MKKVLAALLVAAAAALGAFLFRLRSRLAPTPGRPAAAALRPSPADVQDPSAPPPRAPRRRAVASLPMIKLSVPPKPARRGAVPPPVPARP